VSEKTNSIVQRGYFGYFNAVFVEDVDGIIVVHPSVEVLDNNNSRGDSRLTPAVDVNAVLVAVRLVVAPQIVLVTRGTACDVTSLGATCRHVVGHDGLGRPLDVDARKELDVPCLVFYSCHRLALGHKIVLDCVALSFVKDAVVDEPVDDVVLDGNVVGRKNSNGRIVAIVEGTFLDIRFHGPGFPPSTLRVSSLQVGKSVTRVKVVVPAILTTTKELHIFKPCVARVQDVLLLKGADKHSRSKLLVFNLRVIIANNLDIPGQEANFSLHLELLPIREGGFMAHVVKLQR